MKTRSFKRFWFLISGLILLLSFGVTSRGAQEGHLRLADIISGESSQISPSAPDRLPFELENKEEQISAEDEDSGPTAFYGPISSGVVSCIFIKAEQQRSEIQFTEQVVISGVPRYLRLRALII